MIKIKYEKYHNDYCRLHETISLNNMADLENWLWKDVVSKASTDFTTTSFPTPKEWNDYLPWCITIRKASDNKYDYWIHQIEKDNVIIFSDGVYTDSQKHWSKEMQELCIKWEAWNKNGRSFNFSQESFSKKDYDAYIDKWMYEHKKSYKDAFTLVSETLGNEIDLYEIFIERMLESGIHGESFVAENEYYNNEFLIEE